MKTRTIATAISAAALALTAAGCAKDDTSTATESGIELVKTDTLTICTHLPYEPFEFTEGGEVVGFDVDVLKIAADAEGWDTKVVDIGWETIVSGEALNTGQCDVAAGAMSITPEREAVMDFPEQYFEAKQALLMKAGVGTHDELLGIVNEAIASDDYDAAYEKWSAPLGVTSPR